VTLCSRDVIRVVHVQTLHHIQRWGHSWKVAPIKHREFPKAQHERQFIRGNNCKYEYIYHQCSLAVSQFSLVFPWLTKKEADSCRIRRRLWYQSILVKNIFISGVINIAKKWIYFAGMSVLSCLELETFISFPIFPSFFFLSVTYFLPLFPLASKLLRNYCFFVIIWKVSQ
jgi:hypothetical protein